MADINTVLGDFRRLNPGFEQPETLRCLLEGIVFRYFLRDTNAELAAKLFDYLFAEGANPVGSAGLSNTADSVYLSNIISFRERIKNRTYIEASGVRISSASRNADFLAESITEWPLLRVINFALLLAIRPSKRAAVVTSIRNEGVSILEWVAHYRSLGFDEIFVYTNNNTDGSAPLLLKLAKSGAIRLIENDVDPAVAPQVKAYEHSLHLLPELRQYRWVFYLDADEFFIPRCEPGLNVDDFFIKLAADCKDSPPSAIAFNWKWFGSENAYDRTNGFLLRRFVHSIHNEHVKTLTQVSCILSMRMLHCPILFDGCSTVDSKFDPVTAMKSQVKPVYGTGQINHYWNKSFQEFVIKKFRGRGAVGAAGSQRDFSAFFDWGANSNRGNFDPPPSLVVNRTQAAYEILREKAGVADELAAIDAAMYSRIAEFDKQLDLRQIYDRRGKPESPQNDIEIRKDSVDIRINTGT
jgi:hypothetical protein